MIKRTVVICGREVTFGASALAPKIYRNYYGRDILQDIKSLQKKIQKANALSDTATDEQNEAALSAMDLTIFERIAWTMAHHADKKGIVPKNLDEWLEDFDGILSIHEVFPVILDLWGLLPNTTSD